jgi:hypothetical protein
VLAPEGAGPVAVYRHPARPTDIQATGIPPTDDRESAVVQTLVPGPYTAIVRGKSNSTGIGLVEIYNLQ